MVHRARYQDFEFVNGSLIWLMLRTVWYGMVWFHLLWGCTVVDRRGWSFTLGLLTNKHRSKDGAGDERRNDWARATAPVYQVVGRFVVCSCVCVFYCILPVHIPLIIVSIHEELSGGRCGNELSWDKISFSCRHHSSFLSLSPLYGRFSFNSTNKTFATSIRFVTNLLFHLFIFFFVFPLLYLSAYIEFISSLFMFFLSLFKILERSPCDQCVSGWCYSLITNFIQ